MSLRELCIEAGVLAIVDVQEEFVGPDREMVRVASEAAFDAVLGVLRENADQWTGKGSFSFSLREEVALSGLDGLLSVLEDTDD